MGAKQKKSFAMRLATLGVFLVAAILLFNVGLNFCFGECSVNGEIIPVVPERLSYEISDPVYWGTENFRGQFNVSGEDIYVASRGQLAALWYELSQNDNVDYSGYTVHIQNDINLSTNNDNLIWCPIERKDGKHTNLKIIGERNEQTGELPVIRGLTIILNDHTTKQVGLFASLVGGEVSDINFENPIIQYTYTETNSYPANTTNNINSNKPTAPVDICAGIIAGSADSTYISNVNIINPQITVEAENLNGHHFYVGAAVGKLTYTTYADDDKTEFTNTIYHNKWGLDRVNVAGGSVALNVKYGTTCESYGIATEGYLGGLVGANISSKMINCKLKDLVVNPIFSNLPQTAPETFPGIYYVGGLTGMTTLRACSLDTMVAAGLYNNIVISDIEITTIDVDENETKVANINYLSYVGGLVGRVYAGSWIYNNVYIGNRANDSALWGGFENTVAYTYTHNCLGYIGGFDKDDYFLDAGTAYPDCAKSVYTYDNKETYYYCSHHSSDEKLYLSHNDQKVNREPGDPDNRIPYANDSTMMKYNHGFIGIVSDEDSQESPEKFFQNFVENEYKLNELDEESKQIQFGGLDLLSNYEYSGTGLFETVKPIIEYERGLTVQKNDLTAALEALRTKLEAAEITEAEYNQKCKKLQDDKATDERYDAVRQFCLWTTVNNTFEPRFGASIDKKYTITFYANSKPNTTAIWNSEKLLKSETLDIDKFNKQSLIADYKYLQIITEPTEPTSEGHDFVGWYTQPSCEEADKFSFGGRLKENIKLYAKWELQTFTVSYFLEKNVPYKFERNGKEYSSENVQYGATVWGPTTNPVSPDGKKFAGWFLEKYLPEEGDNAVEELAWRFSGSVNPNLMPGNDVELYVGWIDTFTVLRDTLNDENLKFYRESCAIFFEPESYNAFITAFDQAYRAVYPYLGLGETEENTPEPSVLLLTLNETVKNLRIVPESLLKLNAFNPDVEENIYPFLYTHDTYLRYNKYKETINEYINLINSLSNDVNNEEMSTREDALKDIKTFMTYVNTMNEYQNELEENYAITRSEAAEKLKSDYDILNQEIAKLPMDATANDKYTAESFAAYEAARDVFIKNFDVINAVETGNELKLGDLQVYVHDLYGAIANLKEPDAAPVIDQEPISDPGNGVPQLPIEPVLLGIIIVAALGALDGGFITFDMLFVVRRAEKRQKLKRVEEEAEDSYV